MIENLAFDSAILSRIQFAFTIGFHIIFPTLNIGLGLFLLILESLYLKTNNNIYLNLYKFWVKIFALAFGIGVVTGIPLSYEFGTNFSEFSRQAGPVMGPMLSVEVMTAFFLEAAFIGVMIFGWGKVSKKIHLMATILVVLGTHNSAFWVISANSWMHTPAGVIFDQEKNIFIVKSWMEIIFNPSFLYRLAHSLMASYVACALLVSGIGAYYILIKKAVPYGKKSLQIGIVVLLITAPLQIFLGDLHGLEVLRYQPLKIAAMEGLWETTKGADLLLFAVPDVKNEKNNYEIKIPKLSSLILTHHTNGEVKGLKEWSKENRPYVPIVFYSFRVMVGLGMLFLLIAVTGGVLLYRKKLYDFKPYLFLVSISTPLGFIATISGWFVAETGRQPYVVYGYLKTMDAATKINSEVVLSSLIAFIIIYSLMFISFIFYVHHVIKKTPAIYDNADYNPEWLKVATHTNHVTEKK
jgi:cytochrome bd ubiquinol oxidase subunit I